MQGIKLKQQEAEKVKDMLQNYERRNDEEKTKLQESLQKPQKMIEKFDTEWRGLLDAQGIKMQGMIQ